MTLTKDDLIQSIHNQSGFSKHKARDVIETVFELMKKTMEADEDVLISGFGKFTPRRKASRKGRNPATGEQLQLDARTVVIFRCSGVMRDRINGDPLDEQLELWEHHWSESVVKYAVWLSGLVTFAEAATILNTIGEIPISASSLWRRVAVWGPKCQALEAAQRAASLATPTREELNPSDALVSQDLGAAMDGGMVHIRDEGWKELKVGCVFAIRQQPTRDKHTGEIIDLAHAVANTYVAHLGGPAVFGETLWAEARQRHWMQARETVVLGDGASWIWNLAADKFFTSRQVADWYHAKLHLTQAATALHGEGTAAAQRWLRNQETPLLQGHAERLARTLRKLSQNHPRCTEVLRREAGYFQDNYRRMQYLETREEGFPIGSGMVESACKQFRARLAGPGMRWSRAGLERLLPIRAAIMSHLFDDLWHNVYHLPPN